MNVLPMRLDDAFDKLVEVLDLLGKEEAVKWLKNEKQRAGIYRWIASLSLQKQD